MARIGRGTLATGALAVVLSHCGNGATGVDACRKIEERKCELAVGCPNTSIADAGDVSACKLFYRDQCLLGMADGADPNEAETDTCLAALGQAGACKTGALEACSDAPKLALGQDATKLSGCEVLLRPETLVGCGFLLPVGGGGAGGDGGSGGSGGS
jgi:hypothetical protein